MVQSQHLLKSFPCFSMHEKVEHVLVVVIKVEGVECTAIQWPGNMVHYVSFAAGTKVTKWNTVLAILLKPCSST